MEGELWVRNILMTCFIYCGPFFIMFGLLNTVAIAYRVRGERREREREREREKERERERMQHHIRALSVVCVAV